MTLGHCWLAVCLFSWISVAVGCQLVRLGVGWGWLGPLTDPIRPKLTLNRCVGVNALPHLVEDAESISKFLG